MIEIVKELGFDFNVHQLQEAMEEVDRDGNHCLDFFEYMLIIDNIYRKRGNFNFTDILKTAWLLL
jgi:Ca2+-binding EF-hand superfamily protein